MRARERARAREGENERRERETERDRGRERQRERACVFVTPKTAPPATAPLHVQEYEENVSSLAITLNPIDHIPWTLGPKPTKHLLLAFPSLQSGVLLRGRGEAFVIVQHYYLLKSPPKNKGHNSLSYTYSTEDHCSFYWGGSEANGSRTSSLNSKL